MPGKWFVSSKYNAAGVALFDWCQGFLLLYLNRIHRFFESRACMKDHDSACGNHDWLACFWISSKARVLPSHGETAKFGDRDRFPLLQGGLEEFKNPIQQHGRICFRYPGFLMDAVSNVLLLHWTLV